MDTEFDCWKCGARVAGLPQPLSRREECPSCHADLRVCRACVFYDTSVAGSCREPVADDVHDKERANFCGYFTLRVDAYTGAGAGGAEVARARSELDALFGEPSGSGSPDTADAARAELDRLFGDDTGDRGDKT